MEAVRSHFLSDSGEKLATQVMARNVKTELTVQNNRIKQLINFRLCIGATLHLILMLQRVLMQTPAYRSGNVLPFVCQHISSS